MPTGIPPYGGNSHPVLPNYPMIGQHGGNKMPFRAGASSESSNPPSPWDTGTKANVGRMPNTLPQQQEPRLRRVPGSQSDGGVVTDSYRMRKKRAAQNNYMDGNGVSNNLEAFREESSHQAHTVQHHNVFYGPDTPPYPPNSQKKVFDGSTMTGGQDASHTEQHDDVFYKQETENTPIAYNAEGQNYPYPPNSRKAMTGGQDTTHHRPQRRSQEVSVPHADSGGPVKLHSWDPQDIAHHQERQGGTGGVQGAKFRNSNESLDAHTQAGHNKDAGSQPFCRHASGGSQETVFPHHDSGEPTKRNSWGPQNVDYRQERQGGTSGGQGAKLRYSNGSLDAHPQTGHNDAGSQAFNHRASGGSREAFQPQSGGDTLTTKSVEVKRPAEYHAARRSDDLASSVPNLNTHVDTDVARGEH